jgi:alpha-1,6-mannosyltransferase
LVPGIRTETYPGTGIKKVPTTARFSPDLSERWFGRDSEKFAKLAFVGRFSPEKGLDDFLAIADLLAAQIPVRVAIAGGAPTHPAVSNWLASRPWARCHGILTRPHVAQLLAAADVLVSPSRTTAAVKEQFGKAPVEAMALGTPVFAFDCGALREVVGDGGVIVQEGLCQAMVDELERHFRTSEETRSALAAQARAQAAHFTDAALAEGLVRLWSELEGTS